MLKQKATAASFWSVVEILGRQGIGMISTVVLARLLSPSDFGTIALIAVLTGLSSVFVDSGFSQALIQRQDITPKDESSVFWFNTLASSVFAVGIVALWPIVAGWFGAPLAQDLAAPFAVAMWVSSLSTVQLARLTKKLELRRIAAINTVSACAAASIAIGLALKGWGPWAIAAQAVAAAVLTSGGLWATDEWRPTLTFEILRLKRLFSFGGYMFLAALVDRAAYGLQNALLGKNQSVHDLGLYNRAESTLNLPQSVINAASSKVAFPLFSGIHQQPERLLRGVRMALRVTMLINAPIMLGLMVVSGPMMELVLGQQWRDAAPVFAVLCLVGLVWPVQSLFLAVLSGLGRSDLFFWIGIAVRMISIPCMFWASHHGALWMAWTQVVVTGMAVVILGAYVAKICAYDFRQQIRDVIPSVTAGVVMSVGVSTLVESMPDALWEKVLSGCALGAISYLGILLLCRSLALSEFLALLRRSS